MSKANPTKAIHAPACPRLSTARAVCRCYRSRWRITQFWSVDSPFLWEAERCKTEPVDGIKMLASLYIVTHDAKAVHRDLDVLEELAVSWANELPVSIAQELKAAVHRQFDSLTEVLPETADGKKSGHNGWIVSLANSSAAVFGWAWDTVFTRRQQLL